MYMKKTMYFWLMALLIGGISMAVTSCKADDKKNSDGSGSGDGEEQVVSRTQTPEAEMAAHRRLSLPTMQTHTHHAPEKT